MTQNYSRSKVSLFESGVRGYLLIVALMSGCSTSPSRPQSIAGGSYGAAALSPGMISQSQGEYRLQIGDVIDVFVIEDSSFNGAYPVRQSGDIIIPRQGRIPVAGKRLVDAEAAIKKALETTQLKQATVVVDPGARREASQAGVRTLVVRLSGNVAKTGRTTISQVGNNPVTAFQAIMDVGGFTSFANKKKASIIRVGPNGTSRIPVNFEAIEEGRAQDVPLMDGDSIVVPQKAFGF